ncbi:MAG: 4-hydroxy-tetrahydrodipicolinate synthase [Solitalea-like symbiont of Tyrophagus putrescentiae]
MSNISTLKGVGVAMITPFKSDKSVDIDALKKLSQTLISSNIKYLTILGTTSEAATLNQDEKHSIIDIIMQENNGIKGIVIGVGGNNTHEVSAKAKEVSKIKGVDAILSVSPYYNKPSQKGIIEHFKQIADASEVPIILYNVPGRTSSNMEVQTILQLAEHPNILGVKEASGNIQQTMELLANKPKDFLFISGDDNLVFPQVTLGADGVISVIANAYPNEMANIVLGAQGLNMDAARKEHYKLLNIINLIFKEGNPSGIKFVLELLGICHRWLRLPLVEASKELGSEISKAIKHI